MECEIRRARYLSEISTVRELKEARRELEIREWFARERLIQDAYDTFTIDNLLSMVVPPGSLADRVIGGVGTGIAAVQGIAGAISSLLGARASRSGKSTVRHRTSGHIPKAKSASARPAARKRNPEIEVEVELEPKRAVRSRSKKS